MCPPRLLNELFLFHHDQCMNLIHVTVILFVAVEKG